MDLSALGLSFIFVWRVFGSVPVLAVVFAIVVAALIPLRPVSGKTNPWREFIAALPRRIVTVLATAAFLHFVFDASECILWFAAAWPVIAILFGLDWSRILERPR
jgi:hypothetical protein